KSGYRLLTPVEELASSAGHSRSSDPLSRPSQPSIPWRRWAALGFATALVGVLAVWLGLPAGPVRPSEADDGVQPLAVPVTSYPGEEFSPALSPDGNKVAFIWNGEDPAGDLYLRMVEAESLLRLTRTPQPERLPAWSPDGRSIAFQRGQGDDCSLYTVSALGGPARRLTGCSPKGLWSLSWTPDGRGLLLSEPSDKGALAIFLLDLQSLERRQLTRPPKGRQGDLEAVLSPDGRRLAFLRSVIFGISDLYLLDLQESAQPRRLTFDALKTGGVDWSPDGRWIYFSSNRRGSFELWRIDPAVESGPEWVPAAPGPSYGVSLARHRGRLAYTRPDGDVNIWSLDLASETGNADAGAGPARRWQPSTRWESHPSLSPDGRRVAVASTRSGTPELWVCDADGSGPRMLTDFGGPYTGHPAWSPDGRRIAFDSRSGGSSKIWVAEPETVRPIQVTAGDSSDMLPSWSRDGQTIYFASNRGGDWQIWAVQPAGATVRQITRHGGFRALESADGDELYFSKHDSPGIWSLPLPQGTPRLLTDRLPLRHWGSWLLQGDALIFYDPQESRPKLTRLQLPSGRETHFTWLPGPPTTPAWPSPPTKPVSSSAKPTAPRATSSSWKTPSDPKNKPTRHHPARASALGSGGRGCGDAQ
ncbi:MAG TPA: hypothetical protein VLV83_04925, partial [Acidobacteriota bacterium]|nr:hypothetical protein [Acidobacteriota bacterium]